MSYENSDFIHTSAVRAIVVTIFSLLYIAITKTDIKVDRKTIPPLVYIAIAGTVFADLMYFLAISMVPVINAVIIAHMQPIFVTIFGFALLEERPSKYDYYGMASMLLSAFMITGKNLHDIASLRFGSIGDAFVLFATISWATTAIVARKYLRQINSAVITFYRFLIASLIFLIWLHTFTIKNIYQVIVGIVVAIGTIFYYEGLKKLKTAQVASLELTSPFFAAILAFMILGEGSTLLQAAGIAILFAGIYFLSKKEIH